MREMGVELHPGRELRSRLASVCLRTSSGSRRKSLPSSSSRSKATRKTSGRGCDAELVKARHPRSLQQTASPSIRQTAHLQVVHSPDNERKAGGPVMPVPGQQPDANRRASRRAISR